MPLKMRYRILDEYGKVIMEGPCHSWTQNMLTILVSMFANTTSQGIVDINGTARTLSFTSYEYNYPFLRVASTIGNVSCGIIVGTGTNNNSPTDYKLQTYIAHGIVAGQLLYGVTGVSTAAGTGTGYVLIIQRTFTNGSVSTITVNEIGMYTQCYVTAGTMYVCIARDKLSSPLEITSTGSRTIQYLISCSN